MGGAHPQRSFLRINLMKKILSNGNTNEKTKKNVRETLILYLTPVNQNSKGINLCPKASDGCASSCLYTAGRGAFNSVQKARLERTELMLGDRKAFLTQVISEINRKAKRTEGELAVRFNGTSDFKLVELAIATNLPIEPNVVFYDYTKIISKAGERMLSSGHRYVVTFSRSEVNEQEAIAHLQDNGIVAVVFDELPNEWNGFKVYDGDLRDDLMLDIPKGSVLGLYAKGKARKDTTGFVVKTK